MLPAAIAFEPARVQRARPRRAGCGSRCSPRAAGAPEKFVGDVVASAASWRIVDVERLERVAVGLREHGREVLRRHRRAAVALEADVPLVHRLQQRAAPAARSGNGGTPRTRCRPRSCSRCARRGRRRPRVGRGVASSGRWRAGDDAPRPAGAAPRVARDADARAARSTSRGTCRVTASPARSLCGSWHETHCTNVGARSPGARRRTAADRRPRVFVPARAKDTGWSFDRSVPTLRRRRDERARRSSRSCRCSASRRAAIVPSWQLRHSRADPVGWPARPARHRVERPADVPDWNVLLP